ncbi:MAG: stage II sporulation protein P [Oscillospiraceae bacterium]|nr:stage II sporulation protein P [Oscillospiraceae bacterium]
MIQPLLLSSLRALAFLSAAGARPQQSMTLWKEEILSSQNIVVENIPSVDTLTLPNNEEPLIITNPEPSLEDSVEASSEEIPTPNKSTPVSIPEEYQGPIIEETMSGQAKTGFPTYGVGLIKNSSNLSDEEVSSIAAEEHNLSLGTEGPQVLIYHTHATESFEPYDSDVYDTRNTWRSTDSEENMIAVGNAIAAAIEAHGIEVIHDDTLHDYPSYNGSYERSAVTIEDYLEQYPSICVALDIHRDAIQRDDTLVKPVVTINGKKAAQLMIIAGCDDSGSLGIPTWKDNLRFGVRLQDQIESMYPGLCRPLYFTYRKYNQHLTNASLLFEIGSHGNTLEEAIYCGQMAGDAIGAYLAAQL